MGLQAAQKQKIGELERLYKHLFGDDFWYETSALGSDMDLFLWSLLMRRKSMVKMLWGRMDTPVPFPPHPSRDRRFSEFTTSLKPSASADSSSMDDVSPTLTRARRGSFGQVRSMLMAACMCRSWAKQVDLKVHVREALLQDASEYEQLATGVQSLLMRIDSAGAMECLELSSRLWKGLTGLV
eukprot:2544326-Rhodomonas_salina.4